jgi:hypothetical protein
VGEAALALLLVHIAQHRARNRAHANAIRKESGKFIEGEGV